MSKVLLKVKKDGLTYKTLKREKLKDIDRRKTFHNKV